MANLPTAYASQRFGAKTLDFYAAAGEVVGADPRARADERRLQDIDGARHAVRLMDVKFALEPGDQASVLRLQPGPSRRSRPVAVVNHTHGGWSRTHPGASGLLSRAGIARNVNWTLTMAMFALAALACVWPYMIAFLTEMAPGAFASVPALDVFALAAAAVPGLAGWSLADAAAPLAGLLGGVRPGLESLAPALAYGAAAVLGAVLVFSARSWRLLWAPLFVAALGAGALGFGGAAAALTPALAGLGLAACVFLIGGAWNRVSDAARLESRIALLADHLLTNAPEETVAYANEQPLAEPGDEPVTEPEAGPEAEPGRADTLVEEHTAVAVAASLRALEGEDAASGEADSHGHDAALADIEPTSADADDAEPAPDVQLADASTEHSPSSDQAETILEEAGEAERVDALTPAGLDHDEAERLRTDPRYASRAILLPPPPPMPAPQQPDPGAPDREASETSGADAQSQELETVGGANASPGAPASTTATARTLNPGKPLPDNVTPIFAAPPPSRDG